MLLKSWNGAEKGTEDTSIIISECARTHSNYMSAIWYLCFSRKTSILALSRISLMIDGSDPIEYVRYLPIRHFTSWRNWTGPISKQRSLGIALNASFHARNWIKIGLVGMKEFGFGMLWRTTGPTYQLRRG